MTGRRPDDRETEQLGELIRSLPPEAFTVSSVEHNMD